MAIPDLDPRNQLLPNLIDRYALIKPDAIYAEYPVNPTSYDKGYRKITYKNFANAINGIAHWLTEQLGPGDGKGVLAYTGGNDLRYPALVLGAVKAGYCAFLPSPRNSVAANQSLLQKLDCTTLLTPMPHPPFRAAILKALEGQSVKCLDMPSLDTLLTNDYPDFPYSKKYPDAVTDPLLIVHTSGSTGIPKPITWTLESALRHTRMQLLECPEGYKSQDQYNAGKRVFVTLPPFHAAGMATMIMISPQGNQTAIMPTAVGLPTADALVAARKQTQFDSAFVVPSIVLELSQSPELLDYCSTNLEYIYYAGGDLPQPIGDKVAAKLPLMNRFGSTEVGLLNSVYGPNRDPLVDWRYLEFHPEVGVELRHVSGEDYETIMVRSPTRESNQCPFVLFPDLQEYSLNDLMVRHPDPAKPNLWRPTARGDDIIVFLNGEKTNPVSMEQAIVAANSEVTGCVVIGAQRLQAALLVETNNGQGSLSISDRAAMIEKLWPSIEQANQTAPAHARIAKSHILFTSGEPLPRASKGTLQRAQALSNYKKEIDNLYRDAEKLAYFDVSVTQIAAPGAAHDTKKVTEYVRAVILSIAKWNPDFSDEDNWFTLGLDSLQAITATRVLKNGLNLSSLAPNTIYLSPTVAGLTTALQSLQQENDESTTSRKKDEVQERENLLQELIEKIREKPQAQVSLANSASTHTVVLTGSTGQLGSYILDALLKDSKVGRVYCLDRGDDAQGRQRERGAAYGLTIADEARVPVTFWKADLSQPEFGLQSDQLEELQQATHVIHNAWTVNFNLPLAFFKPQLVGVVNLINFISQSKYGSPQFFFVSSMSSVMGDTSSSFGVTPETLVTMSHPGPNGYANSKYIAEHLLRHAAQQGIPCSFARVGQVAGSIQTPGLWSKSEWFPTMVMSSIYLGALPDTLGSMDRIDWLPIDRLAEIIVDLGLRDDSEPALNVYHLLNVNPEPWDRVNRFIVNAVEKTFGKSLKTIPLQEWARQVRQDSTDQVLDETEIQENLQKNPALKLLDFFEAIQTKAPANILDTQATARSCEKLRDVDAVKEGWIQKWVQEWKSCE
ncbi:NRPS-like enzyme [Penicillium malachiteum]|uniref:NRPS-like enzyme n=1 Tax=Penicillium malachiteum TaxID=1324776 RepID=UPI0025477BBB|nr:NRPS-like enzyme [Penicillium malachiteum]KAJ5726313.1 NRPS-like enzyme [Penicillium malachiteum]